MYKKLPVLSSNLTKNKKEEKLCRKHILLRKLTFQELNILCLIGLGYTSKEIADKLFISVRTVEVHRRNIMFKLNAKTRKDLVKIFIETGLILPYLLCIRDMNYCYLNKKLCPSCKKFYF